MIRSWEKQGETVSSCREGYFLAAPAVVKENAWYGLPWFERKGGRTGAHSKWSWRSAWRAVPNENNATTTNNAQ